MTPPAQPIQGPGGAVLLLLSYRPVATVLPELARRRRRPSHIEREHQVASTTFHARAGELLQIGAITRGVETGPPRQVVYELGPTGMELCELIGGWLMLLSQTTGGAVDWRTPRRCAEAWAAGVIPALLDGPRPLSEVEFAVRSANPRLTAHQIKRLVDNLLVSGMAERSDAGISITDLGRLAIGELAASARFERRHMADVAAPIAPEDGANALRGTLPLIALPEHPGGICEFVVKAADKEGAALAMTWADVREGRVVATGLGPAPASATTWAQGTIDDWLDAVIDHRPRVLRAAGEPRLSRKMIDHLHTRLYDRDGGS
ncbi:MAG: hypothetical protein JSU06_06480 [Actinobacteria bacterium]|nr:hypothetical protein [Actinomycetota bacterium]